MIPPYISQDKGINQLPLIQIENIASINHNQISNSTEYIHDEIYYFLNANILIIFYYFFFKYLFKNLIFTLRDEF